MKKKENIKINSIINGWQIINIAKVEDGKPILYNVKSIYTGKEMVAAADTLTMYRYQHKKPYGSGKKKQRQKPIKAEDRIGTVVNGWKITKIIGKDKYGASLFEAVSTITGKTIENARINWIQEGDYSHYKTKVDWINRRIHRIFVDMKHRCYNKNCKDYNTYGKRGIAIYQEWLNNPKAFEEWALEHGYQDDLTIDRIDVDGNYEPSNCRWISNQENAKWRRTTVSVWIDNYLDTASGWSQKVGKNHSWFTCLKQKHGYDYAYQRLLEEIEKLGGIKKVMGVSEEHDISQFLEDIENDCLEVDL